VDANVRTTLRRIREDHDFRVIRIYRTLAEFLNRGADRVDQYPMDTEDFILLERFDEQLSEFHSWFDVPTYYRRKTQIGCIVAALRSSQTIDRYYSEIREAYAFGCHRACVALCRSLIELVLHDALVRRELLLDTRVSDITTDRSAGVTLSYLIDRASKNPAHNPIIGRTEREAAWRVKNEADHVLHFRDRAGNDDFALTEDESFDLIRDTIRVVEAVISR